MILSETQPEGGKKHDCVSLLEVTEIRGRFPLHLVVTWWALPHRQITQSRNIMNLKQTLGACLVGFLLLAPEVTHGSQEMRKEMGELAKGIKGFLDGRNAESIAIGQFTGPANLPTSAGPGLVQVLTEELQKLKVNVKARAELGLKGEYRLTEVPAENPDDARLGKKVLALKVQASIEDSFGNSLLDVDFQRTVRGADGVAGMIGLTASLDPKATEIERDRELRKQLTNPTPVFESSVIRSRPDSPCGIELIVNDKPRLPTDQDGLAYVGITRGEQYGVRLYNDSDIEMAVSLRIDGLSMYAFSEVRYLDGPRKGEPRYSMVILAPHKSVTIPGWHVNNEKTDRFMVMEYAKSAAASLNHTANVGTITATFQASWSDDQSAPADEPGRARGQGNGDATGFGPRIDQKYIEVKRNFGVIRDVVSVRYTK